MIFIKKLFSFFLLSFFVINTSVAAEVDKTEPYKMIKQVSENLFDRLKAEKAELRDNPEILKVVVEEELMPYINYRYAALKVLGSHLRSEKNKDNINEFIDAFHDYLIASYAQVLTLYSDQVIAFEPEQPVADDRRITSVKLEVIDPPRPNIKLEFKLRKEKNSGEWYGFDMVAEGISLLSSKQSEWSAQIRKDGIPSVSKELIRLSAQPIRYEGEGQ